MSAQDPISAGIIAPAERELHEARAKLAQVEAMIRLLYPEGLGNTTFRGLRRKTAVSPRTRPPSDRHSRGRGAHDLWTARG